MPSTMLVSIYITVSNIGESYSQHFQNTEVFRKFGFYCKQIYLSWPVKATATVLAAYQEGLRFLI
jgi:hypothetical protein